jgi:hypothetical protein
VKQLIDGFGWYLYNKSIFKRIRRTNITNGKDIARNKKCFLRILLKKEHQSLPSKLRIMFRMK